jgi:FkbM family methyltransferase
MFGGSLMKYFIDGGANDGRSAKMFRRDHDPNNEYYIYSFEVIPLFFKSFKDIPNLTLIKKAIWTKDGDMLFYKCRGTRQFGGSVIKEKINVNTKKPIKVDCIDFCKWIKKTFNTLDEIILKFDIEGSEYAVLEKMLENKIFDEYNIVKLFIEWHWYKIGLSKERHDALVSKLNVPIYNKRSNIHNKIFCEEGCL